ncbi:MULTISPECIES: TetR/AcrR family transcriptional regulator [unclassified Pseudonocardia]|uniref:TetR/AcrR family transcriptional regulator n=1 Tax=unclassified Pseudonocardia TaxID=2619320 RepID=UPI000761DA74|nr:MULTISPECIES: TetR/AcrR family transcriptional regulator [unclassified Pseudonocardia]
MPDPASALPALPGRPRDPEATARVQAAALELFAETGWNGLTIEAVARQAGVGKPTVYRRWSDKGALMADALRQLRRSNAVDTGSFAGDLDLFAHQLMAEYRGPYGGALVRFAIEAKFTDEAGQDYALMVRDRIEETTSIVRRAIDRGEVSAGTKARLVISMLHGAIMDFILFDDRPDSQETSQRVEGFLCKLVDAVLHGVATHR